MTHVVLENCIKCKHTDCVEVCPVECFHEGANFLVINPEECIDCGLCIAECPIDAIVHEHDVPADQDHMKAINIRLANIWPIIPTSKQPLPDANEWDGVPNKIEYLDVD